MLKATEELDQEKKTISDRRVVDTSNNRIDFRDF